MSFNYIKNHTPAGENAFEYQCITESSGPKFSNKFLYRRLRIGLPTIKDCSTALLKSIKTFTATSLFSPNSACAVINHRFRSRAIVHVPPFKVTRCGWP